MKKVVFFNFSTLEFGGGCEKNFLDLGLWLKKKGYSISYITASSKLNNLYCSISRQGEHKNNISKQELELKYKVEDYSQFSLIDVVYNSENKNKINKLLSECDVIYSKNEIFETLLLRFFFKVSPTKIVYGMHTALVYPMANDVKSKLHNLFYLSRIYIWLIKSSRLHFLLNSTLNLNLIKKNNLLKNSIIIPNPIDTKKFSLKKYLKKDTFNIYFMGRFTKQKGIDILSSFIFDLSSNPDFHQFTFTFLGTGQDEKYVLELIGKFKNCKYLGFESDIVQHYHNADLVVVPSRWESFCYTVAEAQSCGVIVVASDIDGPRDIIIDRKSGWLFKAEDTCDLSEKILKAYSLWKDKYFAFEEMGNVARETIVNKFESNIVNSDLEKFLFNR